MMPSVVPKPSNWTWAGEMVAAWVPMPPVAMNSIRTPITTMLLITGVHMGAANRLRAFSTPPAIELTP
jgi:hypothetical protein